MHYVYILLFYGRYHHNIDQEFLRLSLPAFTACPVVERDYSAADRTCIPLLLFFQKPVYSVFLHIQRLFNETCSITFSIASVQIPDPSAREITAFIAVGYASFSCTVLSQTGTAVSGLALIGSHTAAAWLL